MRLSRRELLKLGSGIVAASVTATCGAGRSRGEVLVQTEDVRPRGSGGEREGVLRARPGKVGVDSPPGEMPLKLGGERDGLLYVPPGYRRDRPAPLALVLHGAGGSAPHGMSLLKGFADRLGLILLAPDSRHATWDVISGYGPDVSFINQALEQTFKRYAVNGKKVAFAGFSDGASYALSLGITNGDLATHVIAFSPGFMAPTRQRGTPRLYISHGTQDRVLPIDRCSRRIVPQVRQAGYFVQYREFEGPHTVPPGIAREAAEWFAG